MPRRGHEAHHIEPENGAENKNQIGYTTIERKQISFARAKVAVSSTVRRIARTTRYTQHRNEPNETDRYLTPFRFAIL